MHQGARRVDLAQKPTRDGETRGVQPSPASTRGMIPAGSRMGQVPVHRQRECHQPRAHIANPGTTAREHAGQEVGRGERHYHNMADGMRFYGRGFRGLGRRSPTAQLPASQPGILLFAGVGIGPAPVGRASDSGRER